ncbi:uncharacterized protein C8Q71DRAFT_595609 [Rhodofomes roseus]|uniref:DRBM domain-containing protein n=1 Tax=Rhodofomes roseus TaxID=34475 RepID=A0ABQ8KHG5_9APHY|nr:uncharacterized protein C8Q71DRAFT_595609 [Rhodofomes roseus]KAH9837306.1 hypothetical protein C8Q71DRAFT_595609 [Rhodofomes roseus]
MSNEGTVALNNCEPSNTPGFVKFIDIMTTDLQAQNKANLLSWVESVAGPRHEPTWTCICKIDEEEYGCGTGPHKQIARAAAAKVALERLVQESKSGSEAADEDASTPVE